MAESPSELQAEVEKLERKHAENPEGRYFVPLANDYRKMGELERAEALLREGLRKHPDYLSAHIVLGRCLADRGATGEAADEFTYVLSMDPQNLIALRSLGELSAAEGRRDDAGRWYRELLAVDPMNEEARRALEELDAPAEPAPEPEPQEAGGWWDGRSADAEEPATVAADTLGEHRAHDSAGRGEQDERDEPPAGDEQGGYGEFLDLDAASEVESQPEGPEQPEYGIMELSDDAEPADGTDEDEIESVEVVTETIAELYARQGLHDRAADVYRELIRRRGGDPTLERRLAELEAMAPGGAEASQAPALEISPQEESAEEDPFAASFAEGFSDEPAAASAVAPADPSEPDTRHAARSAGGPGGRTIGTYLASLAAWAPGAAEPRSAEALDDSGAAAQAVEPTPFDGVTSPESDPDAFPWESPAEERPAPDHGAEREPQPGRQDQDRQREQEAESAWEPEGGWEVEREPEQESGFSGPPPTTPEPEAPPAPEPMAEAEPAIELEDYFPADEEEDRAPTVEESVPPPPPAQAGASAGEDEDDLESFQAWLRSLKR